MREFFSERQLRHQLIILTALRDDVDPAALPYGAATAIANYLNKIGTLGRAGHVGLKNLYGASQIYQAWWATLAPTAQRMRTDTSLPTLFADFEWLAGRFAELDRRAGVTSQFDAAYVPASLPRRIAITEDLLRVEQELRH